MYIKVCIPNASARLATSLRGKDVGVVNPDFPTRLEFIYNTNRNSVLKASIAVQHTGLQRYFGNTTSHRYDAEIQLPPSALRKFVEDIDEESAARFAPKFTLSQWGCERSVSRMRRRREQGEESSNNQGGERRTVVMPQGELPRERSERINALFQPYTSPMEQWRDSLQSQNVSYEPNPAPTPVSEGIPSSESVRQRWSRARNSMEENGISI